MRYEEYIKMCTQDFSANSRQDNSQNSIITIIVIFIILILMGLLLMVASSL